MLYCLSLNLAQKYSAKSFWTLFSFFKKIHVNETIETGLQNFKPTTLSHNMD